VDIGGITAPTKKGGRLMPEKKKRPMTEARKAANARYDSAAYDKIMLRVRAGRKSEIEQHAARYQPEAGEIGKAGYSPAGSIQGFINRAIDEAIERDTAAETDAAPQADDVNSGTE
jgi:hypothetical protein